MKIALAHDSFTQMGGAERVISVLHETFPGAPVFTLVFDPKFKQKYRGWDIRTSRLQTLYLALGKLQYLLPLIPWGVDSLDFSGYDFILSSSSGFIKNLRAPKSAIHIDYCHTPTRFLWQDNGYLRQEVPTYLLPLARVFLARMKKWDSRGAEKVSYFIANSLEVQKRIKKFYNRDSKVIYPSVDVGFWHPTKPKSDYFLIAGRLQGHKSNDVIVKIFNDFGKPLHIAGAGRQEAYLKSIAKPNISFLGNISDEQLRDEYSGAVGYIYPQLEDFGLMPLEAMACGTATLAYGQGGALETVIPGQTGELFDSYDESKIKFLVSSWNFKKYSADVLRSQAEKFSKTDFQKNLLNFIKINFEKL